MMRRLNWPIQLFWLPFSSSAIISLGSVSSSFLLKRRRQGQSGCLVALDVNLQSPSCMIRETKLEEKRTVPDSSLGSDIAPVGCEYESRLRRKAILCVRSLEADMQVKRSCDLPSRISCGGLRPAIRSCFGHLTEVQELSVKTTQKLERRFCDNCDERLGKKLLQKWKEERFAKVEVSDDHLKRFISTFRRNVDDKWNRGIWPFIPNGHATMGSKRSEGGNWNWEEYSSDCRCEAVVSSGKHRLVTMYSTGYTEALYPLHKSLHSRIQRKGWLLVGDPTQSKVERLNGGDYVSVDYSAATDRIKTAYTSAAVEVLIDKGEGLTDLQKRALRDVGRLTVDGFRAETGQPMGSMMSFPLLCLINKTAVDLVLEDLLIEGKIDFKEWSRHRCLINGDDLLLRAPTSGSLDFLTRLQRHGAEIGLSVNREKTMIDASKGEINSTLFINGEKQKKTNCGALYMCQDVADVVGLADAACVTDTLFVLCVSRAALQLARQKTKFPSPVSCRRYNLCVRNRELRRSLLAHPVDRDLPPNPFPVVPRPAGYALSREEEFVVISAEVARLRKLRYRSQRIEKTRNFPSKAFSSLRKALKTKEPSEEDRVLQILASEWYTKEWGRSTKENFCLVDMLPEHVCDECAELAAVFRISCEIKQYRRKGFLSNGQSRPVIAWDPDCDFVPFN